MSKSVIAFSGTKNKRRRDVGRLPAAADLPPAEISLDLHRGFLMLVLVLCVAEPELFFLLLLFS